MLQWQSSNLHCLPFYIILAGGGEGAGLLTTEAKWFRHSKLMSWVIQDSCDLKNESKKMQGKGNNQHQTNMFYEF